MLVHISLFFLIFGNCTAQEPWKKKCVDHFELLFFTSPTKTYTQAKTFCEDFGGYLAKVDDKKMTYVINSTFKIEGGSNSFFIGGNDREREGDWKWQDGTDVIMRGEAGYQNWKANQPNNVGGNENCALIGRETYEWIDYSCDESLFYICQRDERGRASVRKRTINQTTRECVLSTCDTSATVGWYKDLEKISTDSGNTVYQELKSGSAILYLKRAKISDSGTYSCQARIGNQKKDEITMTYGECSREDLPNDLRLVSDPTAHNISYGEYSVECSSGNLLFNGRKYVTDMPAWCGRHATWKLPQYKCYEDIWLFKCSSVEIIWSRSNHSIGYLYSLELQDVLASDTKRTNVKILFTSTPIIDIIETRQTQNPDYCVTITQFSAPSNHNVTVELIAGRVGTTIKSVAKVIYKSGESTIRLQFVDLR